MDSSRSAFALTSGARPKEEPMTKQALLLLVFAYLFVHVSVIYYRAKLDKEM